MFFIVKNSPFYGGMETVLSEPLGGHGLVPPPLDPPIPLRFSKIA